jgi:hypothetical protein
MKSVARRISRLEDRPGTACVSHQPERIQKCRVQPLGARPGNCTSRIGCGEVLPVRPGIFYGFCSVTYRRRAQSQEGCWAENFRKSGPAAGPDGGHARRISQEGWRFFRPRKAKAGRLTAILTATYQTRLDSGGHRQCQLLTGGSGSQ